MRTLVLIRHAEAEPGRGADHDRRLTARGREEAERVRQWLEVQGLQPDRVVVSTAARARETWELAGVGPVEPEVDERLYEASTQDLRAVLAELAPDVSTLVLVGHNPALERLAWELDDTASARERTDRGLRPGGVAVFALQSWEAEHGSLVAHTGEKP